MEQHFGYVRVLDVQASHSMHLDAWPRFTRIVATRHAPYRHLRVTCRGGKLGGFRHFEFYDSLKPSPANDNLHYIILHQKYTTYLAGHRLLARLGRCSSGNPLLPPAESSHLFVRQ